MYDLASQLKYKATLYVPEEVTNDVGEQSQEMTAVESFWCGIVPNSGKVDRWTPMDLEAEEVTTKITIRMGASKRLAVPGNRNHMYLLIDGVRYDVLYCLPHYQSRDRIIIYAKVRTE